jgi:hypothetical protein
MRKKLTLSRAQKRKILSNEMRRLGSEGGKNRAKKLTPEERSAIARKAAAARWSKQSDES